ncbi:hypothetical protein AGMMS50249_5760 [candidate division SR1 bacterium]|nr:hypothetical protein AGMMS50249_5760 [candidate division SR1 bacterium]
MNDISPSSQEEFEAIDISHIPPASADEMEKFLNMASNDLVILDTVDIDTGEWRTYLQKIINAIDSGKDQKFRLEVSMPLFFHSLPDVHLIDHPTRLKIINYPDMPTKALNQLALNLQDPYLVSQVISHPNFIHEADLDSYISESVFTARNQTGRADPLEIQQKVLDLLKIIDHDNKYIYQVEKMMKIREDLEKNLN